MQVPKCHQLVDLKYCERCGGLWLRTRGAAAVYCSPCGREMAELPAARTTLRGKAGRPKGALHNINASLAMNCPVSAGQRMEGLL